MGVFTNFLRQNEFFCKKPDLGIQFAKNKAQIRKTTKKQSVVSQKQSVVCTSKITTTGIKEFKEERNAKIVYTGSLLTQELHLVSQKPLGNPLGNQIQITYTHHQRSDLDSLKTHTSFGSAHTPPRMLILTTSRAHNPSWLYNTRMQTNHRTNYTVTKSTEIYTK